MFEPVDTVLIASTSPVVTAMATQGQRYNDQVQAKGKKQHGMGPPFLYVFGSMVEAILQLDAEVGMPEAHQKIADFYEDEVEVAVTSMTKLLEPLMMVFIGANVGTVMIAMYLPFFEGAGNMKGGG